MIKHFFLFLQESGWHHLQSERWGSGAQTGECSHPRAQAPLLQQNEIFPTKCAAWNTWYLLFMLRPPPHSSRTTSAWGGRWKRSSEQGKSWSGSSGGFWRTWTTPAGMRPTSEISIYLRVGDKTVSWCLGAKSPMKCCQATVDQMDHQQRLTVILWSQISW